MELEIPVLYYADIRNHADIFLRQYHPSRKIPAPIMEEYIASQLAKDFAVSTRVIEKRLTKDKIIDGLVKGL